MPADMKNLKPVKVILHVVFFLSGIATVLIGQVLPVLIRKFSLNDLEAGYFFPAQFAGSLVGTFLTKYFGRSGKFFVATTVGCVLMASGILLMNSSFFASCLVGFAINGLGIGLTLPSINLLILEMTEAGTAAALSLLNFCWGAGAIVSKPFVDYVGTPESIFLPTLALAIALFLLMGILITLPHSSRPYEPGAEVPTTSTTRIWATPLAWTLAAFNFIHVGFESGIGGWMTTYADRLDPTSASKFLSPTLLYFSFFVLGRAVVPIVFKYIAENRMLICSLIGIAVGLLIALTAADPLQLGIGASITGFGTSTVFPTNVSRFARSFGPEASRRATPFFIAGTLGSALLSWLIGYLSNQLGSLRLAMFVLLTSIVVLMGIQVALMFRRTGMNRDG